METYCSENITKLAQALIAVQKEMTPASRDGTNPFTRSNYATLNSVMESCRDILLAHGIWLTQLPVPAPLELGPGHIALLTKLTHAESGQWQSSLTVIPLPKADPQGMGSAITYGRRYALTAMLGMITEDDDGEAALKQAHQLSGTKDWISTGQYRFRTATLAGRRTLDRDAVCGELEALCAGGDIPSIDIPALFQRHEREGAPSTRLSITPIN